MKIEKGMMLVTILMLTFLLVMLTTSMIFISSQSLNITGLTERKSKALQSAEAGVEYALYQLNNDPNSLPPLNMEQNIGNGQKFIFLPSSGIYSSRNNLRNKYASGSTPPFCAELICKGISTEGANNTESILRAIFTRDDRVDYSVCSDGKVFIEPWLSPLVPTKCRGKKLDEGGRVHSNSTIRVYGANFDIGDGFLSCPNPITQDNSNSKKKEYIVPEKLPDINDADIIEIINNGYNDPNCLKIDPNNPFYLIGYFEYDPNTYGCIPHSASASYNYDMYFHSDPWEYVSSYKLGIASFYEVSVNSFLLKYKNYYYIPGEPPYFQEPGNRNRNFFNQYSSITFREYPSSGSDTAFNNALKNEIGMTMSKDTDPNNPAFKVITLQMEKDIYMPSTCAFFETVRMLEGINPVMPTAMRDARVELNLNNHVIYVNDALCLQVRVRGKGAIVCNGTLDFINSSDVEMVALATENVRMCCQETPGKIDNANPPQAAYRGVIYALNNVLVEQAWWNNNHYTLPDKILIKGAIVSKDKYNNDCTASPLACRNYIEDSTSGVYIHPCDVRGEVVLMNGTDGIDILADLRKNNFAVKKMFCQKIK